MPRPSYLYRRNGVYYVVRRVPLDLVKIFGKQLVRRSLRTSDASLARRRAWAELIEIEREFGRWFESDVAHASGPYLPTKSLSEAIEAWIVDRSPRWSSKMRDDVDFVMPVILKILGDRPVSRITRTEVRGLKSVVSKLPANFSKLRLTRDRPIPEVVRLAEAHSLRLLSTASINRYVGHTHSLFEWCCQEQIIGSNPAKGLSDPRRKRHSEHQPRHGESKQRKPFTTSDLKLLFGQAPWRPSDMDHEFYWPVLLALFQGMRRTEILQLHRSDLAEVDGIRCICVTDSGDGQKLKNRSSVRTIPIHPYVEKLGFSSWVARGNSTRVFNLILPDQRGRYSLFSKRFSNFLRACQLDHVCFHSLRHTWRDGCRDAGVPLELAKRMGGWAMDGVSEQYGNNRPVRRMYEHLSNVDFDLGDCLPSCSSVEAARSEPF